MGLGKHRDATLEFRVLGSDKLFEVIVESTNHPVATVPQLPLDAPAMSKPGIYVLQGLGQEPLTEGLAELTTDKDRWMEVARIAFPKPRQEHEVNDVYEAFKHRFRGQTSLPG